MCQRNYRDPELAKIPNKYYRNFRLFVHPSLDTFLLFIDEIALVPITIIPDSLIPPTMCILLRFGQNLSYIKII
jgi:hypothetical protein